MTQNTLQQVQSLDWVFDTICKNKQNYKPSTFGYDGNEYGVLYAAAAIIKGVPGFTCEIGLRQGGGTEAIIQGFLDQKDNHIHIAIDPYGDIEYKTDDTKNASPWTYSNQEKRTYLPKIYKWASDHNIDFLFFNMENTEFFKRFADGIPIYNKQKFIENRYALVYFDGQHMVNHISEEVKFFINKTSIGGMWIFDDTETYDHKVIHDIVIGYGFKLLRAGHKSVYRKEISNIETALQNFRPINSMSVIQIDITNKCDGPNCSNCTRNLAHHNSLYYMQPDVFHQAIDSLKDYHGVVGIFGGNPTLHPNFEDYTLYLEKSRPRELIGIWTNNYREHRALCDRVYGLHLYNPHNRPVYHQPSLVAIKDIISDTSLKWNLIGKCPINHQWSACVTPTINNRGGVYFCEMMAGFDYMYQENNSLPITPDWWKQPNTYFRKQIEKFCENCGMALPLPARLDKEQTDDVSESNLKYCKKDRKICLFDKSQYDLEKNLKGWLPLDYLLVDKPIGQRNII